MKRIFFILTLLNIFTVYALPAYSAGEERFRIIAVSNSFGITIVGICWNPANNLLYGFGAFKEDYQSDYLFISQDSGRSWQPHAKLPYKMSYWHFIHIDRKGYIYCIHQDGIALSKDDGKSFAALNLGFDYNGNYLDEVIVNSRDEIFVTIRSFYGSSVDRVWYTKNQGETWNRFDPGFNLQFFHVDRDDYIYVIGNEKNVYKYDTVKYSPDYEVITCYLDSSVNMIYRFDPDLKNSQLIDSSKLTGYSTNVFISADNDDDNLYVLSASQIIRTADMYYDDYFISLNIKKIRKPCTPEQEITNIFYPFNKKEVLSKGIDIYSFGLSGDSNIVFNWSDSIYILDKSLTRCTPVYGLGKYSTGAYIDTDHNSNFISSRSKHLISILLSTDNGVSWSIPEFNDEYPLNVSLLYITPDSLTIIVDSTNNIYIRKNKLNGWQKITSNFPPTSTITCLMQTKNGNIVAGTENSGIYYRLDNGFWERRIGALGNAEVKRIVIGNNGELYICSDKGFYTSKNEMQDNNCLLKKNIKDAIKHGNEFLMVSSDGSMFMAEADGRYFNEISGPWEKSKLTSIASNSRGVIIASTLYDGVFKSTDNGRSWAPANNELLSPKVYQVISTKNDEFLALAETGIFFTNNDGEIWEKNPYSYFNEIPDYFNTNDEYRIELQVNGDIYIYNRYFPYNPRYIDSISTEPVIEASGWVNNGHYFENRNTSPVRLKKISRDNKFAYLENIVNFKGIYYVLLYKVDLLTGKFLNENILYYKNAKLLDINDDCSLALLKSLEADNNGIFVDYIILYDIIKDSVLFRTDPASYLPPSDKNIFAVFCEKKNRVYTAATGLDTVGNDEGYCSRGEIQERDLSGRIVKTFEAGFIRNFSFSPELNALISHQEDFAGEFWYDYHIENSYYTLYDLSGEKILKFLFNEPMTSQNEGIVSPDGKYLVAYAGNSFYKCEISKNETESIFELSKFHECNAESFKFIGSDSLLYNNSSIYSLYDFKKMECIKQSLPSYDHTPRSFLPLLGMKKILTTDSKNVVCLHELDQILDDKNIKISIDSTLTYVNNAVHFSVTADPEIKEIYWDFGDGTSAKGWKVSHTYVSEGVFTPVMTYYPDNDNKGNIIYAQPITVITPAVPEFIYSVSNLKDCSIVYVTSTSKGSIIKHVWNFGDGTIKEGTYLSHTYNKRGVYSISLTVHDQLGSRTIIKENIINADLETNVDVEVSSSGLLSKNNTNIYKCLPAGNGSYYIAHHQEIKKGVDHLYKENYIVNINQGFGHNWDIEVFNDSLKRPSGDYAVSDNGDLFVLLPDITEQKTEADKIKVLRYNSEGALIWKNKISEGIGVRPQALTATRDGGCISLIVEDDLYAIEQDRDGNIERKMLVKRDLQPEFSRIIEATDGGYIICYEDDFDRRIMHINDTGKTLLKGIIPDRGSCRDLCELTPSRYLISGNINNSNQKINRRGMLYCYEKFNTGFNEVWRNQNDKCYEYLSAAKINDNYIVATGAYIENDLHYNILNSDGEIVESVNVMEKSGVFDHVLVEPDGSLILSGYIMINEKDYESFIVKTKKIWAGIAETARTSEIQLNISPNPSTDYIRISFDLPSDRPVTLRIISMEGKVIQLLDHDVCAAGEYTLIHDITGLAPGMFIVELSCGKDVITKKFIRVG